MSKYWFANLVSKYYKYIIQKELAILKSTWKIYKDYSRFKPLGTLFNEWKVTYINISLAQMIRHGLIRYVNSSLNTELIGGYREGVNFVFVPCNRASLQKHWKQNFKFCSKKYFIQNKVKRNLNKCFTSWKHIEFLKKNVIIFFSILAILSWKDRFKDLNRMKMIVLQMASLWRPYLDPIYCMLLIEVFDLFKRRHHN